MKLTIATPMYGGNCKGVYTEALINLIFQLSNRGHQVRYIKIYNESLITRARNTLVREFLTTDDDALLFIDADHSFDVSHVIKMIESGHDLIGAIYPMKNINWGMVKEAAIRGEEDLAPYSGFFSANLKQGTNKVVVDQPLEVDNVGTGMMFISRKVFDTMAPHCETYAYHGSDGLMKLDQRVIEFFKTEIDEIGVLLSEDFYFCRQWQRLGGKVYAAPWVHITHAGEYEFAGSFIKNAVLLSKMEQESAEVQETQAETATPKPKKA